MEPGISTDTASRLSNLREEEFTNTAGQVLYDIVSKRDTLRTGTIVSKLLDKGRSEIMELLSKPLAMDSTISQIISFLPTGDIRH